jgi:hypothetical protein
MVFLLDSNCGFDSLMGINQGVDIQVPLQKTELTTAEREDLGTLVITDNYITRASSLPSAKKILWLLEPPAISPSIYESAVAQKDSVYKVYTPIKDLCEAHSNFFYCPWGHAMVKVEDQRLYKKTKDVSIIASSKSSAEGHLLRHRIIDRYGSKISGIKQGGEIEYKLPWTKDYGFSIAVENSRVSGYFTEKILDCFRTGTVPIYWGDPTIGDTFNADGILTFTSLEDLEEILNYATPEFYNKMQEAVRDNYERAQAYIWPPKNLWEAGLKEDL